MHDCDAGSAKEIHFVAAEQYGGQISPEKFLRNVTFVPASYY
jgi:hypothetical protein